MFMKSISRKALIITGVAITSLIVLILIVQIILGSIITSKIHDALSKVDDDRYRLEIDKAKVNLFTTTLIFKGVRLSPDSTLYAKLKNDSIPGPVYKLSIPVLRIRNIGVIGFLRNKDINIGEIVLKESKVDIYISNKKKDKVKEIHPQKRLNSDSISLKGVAGGALQYLRFSQISVNVYNIKTGDTMFVAPSFNLELADIKLEKNQDSTFRLTLDEFNFELKNERFHLPGNKYLLTFEHLIYNKTKTKLQIKDLVIKPRFSREKMISFSPYQYEIYDVNIKNLEVNHLLLGRAARDSGVYITNILVDGMVLDIFKDKKNPFDETKRPKLPQQLLRSLNFDLYIDSINIINSKLIYAEKHTLMEELMHVELDDLDVDIETITSISDSIIAGNVMEISLRANIQNSIPMGVDIYFPMKSVADTFYFSGFMKSGNMKKFNNVLLPALGMSLENGHLDELEFWASANPTYSIGDMKMEYHDLEGNVRKQDVAKTNKFLTWAANQLIMKNNPVPNKKVRTVPMYFQRVEYKGLGNFLWKTLQSGIMATVIPTISNRIQSEIDTQLGTSKNDIKKREREKRKAEKEFKKKQKK